MTSVVRRYEQVIKPDVSYSSSYLHPSFLLYTIDEDPKSIKEAIDSIEGKLWKDVMVEEMESLNKNETWDLVELPNVIKPISSKWVLKKKLNIIGQVKKSKARLVEKGYS
jgi:hypothetical protein